LSLGGTKLDDDALPLLEHMPALRSLVLGSLPLTAAGFELVRCRRLLRMYVCVRVLV
jgi:hypothetical protein